VPEPSNIARITHNLGLATWFGGALFGQIALNPTISRISDRRERGRVLNESWGRFNTVIFATIAATVLTWRLGGLRGDAELKAPALARAKNLLLGGAVINGIASGVMGPGSRKRLPKARRKVEPQSRRGRSPRRRPPKVPPGLSA
jgi:MFS family permease